MSEKPMPMPWSSNMLNWAEDSGLALIQHKGNRRLDR